MPLEDRVLYMVDPDFAIELGVEPPKCVVCGGQIRTPPADWDGGSLRHMIGNACHWVREGLISETLNRRLGP